MARTWRRGRVTQGSLPGELEGKKGRASPPFGPVGPDGWGAGAGAAQEEAICPKGCRLRHLQG